jgi:hypothetical protein
MLHSDESPSYRTSGKDNAYCRHFSRKCYQPPLEGWLRASSKVTWLEVMPRWLQLSLGTNNVGHRILALLGCAADSLLSVRR